jgi:hypothetical protein
MFNRTLWVLVGSMLMLCVDAVPFHKNGTATQVGQSAPPSVEISGGSSPVPGLSMETISVDSEATPRVVMKGTYAGFCTNPYVGTQPTAIVFYGAGQFMPNFNSHSVSDCTNNGAFSGGPPPSTPGEGAAADAAGMGELAPILGNGKLKGLVVQDSIKSAATGTSSGLAEVWVIRSSQIISTGIECTLGTTNRCEDATHTFAVIDGDGLAVTLTDQPGDALQNVQFFLGKQ